MEIKIMGLKDGDEVVVGDLNVKSAQVSKCDPQMTPFFDVVNNFMGTAIGRAVVFNLDQASTAFCYGRVGLVLCVKGGKYWWVTTLADAKLFFDRWKDV